MARGQNEDVAFFEHSMMERMLKDKEISAIFPMAIKREQFEVYYQPKVNINEQKLCGCEALVRWFKNGKMVSPMEFIPVLESEGTICTLDFYVLDKVCQAIKSWIDRDIKPVRVSSNFSKVHLKNPALADRIFAVIDKYGIDPQYIEIELTEMSGYDNYENLAQFIKDMKERGVHTSIDDFGTGYSSLNHIKEMPIDVIKIDKCFTDGLGKDDFSNSFVKMVTELASAIGVKTCIEGVESAEQVEIVKASNVHTIQGYYFGKPMSVSEFEERYIM